MGYVEGGEGSSSSRETPGVLLRHRDFSLNAQILIHLALGTPQGCDLGHLSPKWLVRARGQHPSPQESSLWLIVTVTVR